MNQPGSRVKASTALAEGASFPHALDSLAKGRRTALRRALRAARRAVPAHERAVLDRALARVLAGSRAFRNSRRIAVYLASDGEVDLHPLCERAWARGKRLHLPVLHGRALWFHPYRPDTPLAANRYGIPEPELPAGRRRDVRGLDLVIMPLVAFDPAGNRLGMGAGYYDRTLAFLRHRRHWRAPLLIGAAYELQRLDALPAAPWDVPLDGVVTERALYPFRARTAD